MHRILLGNRSLGLCRACWRDQLFPCVTLAIQTVEIKYLSELLLNPFLRKSKFFFERVGMFALKLALPLPRCGIEPGTIRIIDRPAEMRVKFFDGVAWIRGEIAVINAVVLRCWNAFAECEEMFIPLGCQAGVRL